MKIEHYQFPFSIDLKQRLSDFADYCNSHPAHQKQPLNRNYRTEYQYSLQNVFEKRLIQGGMVLLIENNEIVCLSGYYQYKNLVIGGFRALKNPFLIEKFPWSHGKNVIPFQIAKANELQASCFLVTVNWDHKKMIALLDRCTQKNLSSATIEKLDIEIENTKKSLEIFSDFQKLSGTIHFNGSDQFVYYKALRADFSENELLQLHGVFV